MRSKDTRPKQIVNLLFVKDDVNHWTLEREDRIMRRVIYRIILPLGGIVILRQIYRALYVFPKSPLP